tara:strand:- start:32 stop:769 length:738 start_codon:yes stop_codon:yes gene_type:complete
MCLLINQTNSTPIKREYLENADCSNPDGMGYAYANGGQIHIVKFREFEEFYKAYKKDVKQYGKMSNFILHFRYSTHGVNTGLYNVHPFRVSERLVFAHNGVLDVDGHKKKSDTQVFNETILQKLKPNFLNSPAVCSLIEGFIGSDKLVFLNSDGRSVILNEGNGHWKDGIWYSNGTYKTAPTISYGWSQDYGYTLPAVTKYNKSGKNTTKGTCSHCTQWDTLTKQQTGAYTYGYLCKTCKGYNDK